MTKDEALAQPAQEPAIGDIRALKHRIHELEGEVIGYKQILDAQPAQEPVACVGTNGELMWLNKPRVIYSKPIPLYTAPPQRPWAGLTAEEAAECWTTSATQTWKNFENALRSKNT